MGSVPFFPDQASTVAPQVDAIYFALILLSALFAVPVALLIVYFGVRYRRGSQASRASGSAHGGTLKIELAWTVFPALLALGMFTWAATVYYRIERPPAGAVEVYVVGQQWMWKVQHPEGQREINQLHVPVGRPIKLLMTSQDVIHSFYIAAFRVKQDVLPGRYTTIWFQATQAGDYAINCAEYCGTDHAMMGRAAAVHQPGLQRLPPYGRQRAGSIAGGHLRQDGASARRRDGGRRRGLHPQLDPFAAEPDRRRLRADHAELPGPGERGADPAADRLHQVARQQPARSGQPGPAQHRRAGRPERRRQPERPGRRADAGRTGSALELVFST